MGQAELFPQAISYAHTERPPEKAPPFPVWDLRFGRWQDVLFQEACDTLIVDAPYSDVTHSGHDDGTKARSGEKARSKLGYAPWGEDEIREFTQQWVPRVRGWFVTITDDVLAPIWRAHLRKLGLYTFSPLGYQAPGSRVRLRGDGPCQWSCWIQVARPRHAPYSDWGALPGGYVLPKGLPASESAHFVTGGKPLWLMRALVRDYSRTGETICDPCAGAGTTLRAAVIEGRSAIGAEPDHDTFQLAHARLSRGYTPAMFPEEP